MTQIEKQEGLSKSVKATQAAAAVRELRREHYDRLNHAHDYGEFVAWAMLGVPDEILRAFGVWHAIGENYGPLCAAKQVSDVFCGAAESDGFSIELCSYLRTQLGFAKKMRDLGGKVPSEAPYGGMGKPDMYIAPATFCDGRYKSLQASLRYYDVPYFCYEVMDMPWQVAEQGREAKKRYIEHYYAQLKELVRFLERVTGKKYDQYKLAECLDYWWKGHKALWETWELRKNRPNPWPSQDSYAFCFPYLNYRGTKKCTDYYQRLYDEVKYRVDNKIGTPAQEKYRLFWEGLPPWFYLGLFNWLEDNGIATLDLGYYIGDLPEEPDLNNPLWSIAKKAYDRVWFGSATGRRAHPTRRILRFIKEWGVDGIAIRTGTSCRAATGEMQRMRLLQQEIDVPFLNLEFDMVDARGYSDAHVKSQLEAFMEVVESTKRKRQAQTK